MSQVGSRTDGAQVLWEESFHDGSEQYLPEPPTELGQDFEVLLRVPKTAGVSRVAVRQVHDGEPFTREATLDRTDEHANWYRATLNQHNPVVPYRFLTDAGDTRYRWVTAAGPRDYDPPDSGDFRSSIHPGAPDWVASSVAYQEFPDRFARSAQAAGRAIPEWARPALSWDELPEHQDKTTGTHFYGGDLPGIQEHLDHLTRLGVDLLYLTPFFPAPSNHRYNASTFDRVDPLLGGDQALANSPRPLTLGGSGSSATSLRTTPVVTMTGLKLRDPMARPRRPITTTSRSLRTTTWDGWESKACPSWTTEVRP